MTLLLVYRDTCSVAGHVGAEPVECVHADSEPVCASCLVGVMKDELREALGVDEEIAEARRAVADDAEPPETDEEKADAEAYAQAE